MDLARGRRRNSTSFDTIKLRRVEFPQAIVAVDNREQYRRGTRLLDNCTRVSDEVTKRASEESTSEEGKLRQWSGEISKLVCLEINVISC